MRLRTSRRTSSIDHNQMTCPSASEKCSAQVCPPATHGKSERPGRWTACRSNGVLVVRCPPARPPGSLAREAAGPQRRQDPLARLRCVVVRLTSNRGEKPARASPQPLLLRGPRQTDNAGLPAQLPPPCWAPALLSAPGHPAGCRRRAAGPAGRPAGCHRRAADHPAGCLRCCPHRPADRAAGHPAGCHRRAADPGEQWAGRFHRWRHRSSCCQRWAWQHRRRWSCPRSASWREWSSHSSWNPSRPPDRGRRSR